MPCALRRMPTPERELRTLVEALTAHASMVVVPSKHDMLTYLNALSGAVGSGLEHYGDVRATDAPAPLPLGVTGPDGVRPCVFTEQAPAVAYARQAGGYGGEEAVLTQTTSWGRGFEDCLRRGCAGVVIDAGTDGAVTLDRHDVAQAYAWLTLDDFSRLKCLEVLRADGSYHTQRTPDELRLAFAYDSKDAAQFAVSRLQSGRAVLDAEEVGTYRFVRRILEADVAALVVNFALPDERRYGRSDLVRILSLIEAAAGPDAAADHDAAPSAQVRRVTSSLAPHAMPLLGRDDEVASATFNRLRLEFAQGRLAPWQFMEAFAFETVVHVPVYGEAIDGLAWPQCPTDPQSPPRKMCAVFTRASEIRRALAGVHPKFRRFTSLMGIEALRWTWSAPADVASMAVDYAQPGALQFPLAWARRVLFPAAAEFDDLAKVPPVPWAQLGKLPGVHALRPQVLRTLALGWKPLLSVKDRVSVPIGEGQYVPLFSSQESFFAYLSSSGVPRVAVDPAGAEPPFHRWLRGLGAADGMVLDPAGSAPLLISRSDLAVIACWAMRSATPPTPEAILADAARLRADGALAATDVGRLAADVPSYWFGVRGDATQGFSVVTHNDTSYCLFSSEARARAYIAQAPNLAAGGFQPREAVTRWGGDTVFDHALRSFPSAVIDPVRAGSSTGLVLDRAGLAAALARIDEHLQPRLQGFIWGEPGFRE